MQGDLRSLDPIWTTANITAYHGAMIYDTLFALDEQMRPQPQMVGKWGLSDDKLTYTFELRDGLKFPDGSAVTADDVRRLDPPLGGARRRRPAHDGARQGPLEEGRQDLRHRAARSPTASIFDTMAKTATPLLYIMRKKEAETDPNQQITEYIGSGPFTFNRRRDAAWVSATSTTAIRTTCRAPSRATGMAGGKVVKVDRVIYENMPD